MINVVIASAFGEENKKRILAAGEGKCSFFEVDADTPAAEAPSPDIRHRSVRQCGDADRQRRLRS